MMLGVPDDPHLNTAPPRLADVAREAGVSTGTVSHALRGDRRIRKSTRQKVVETAERLGYSVDVHASVLGSRRGGKTSARDLIPIAVVHEKPLGGRVRDAAEKIKFRARDMGYDLQDIALTPEKSPAKHLAEAWHRGVEGVILRGLRRRPELLEIEWSRFSIVGLGREPEDLPIPRIRPNNFSSAKRLWEICWERGYRRIGSAPLSHSPRVLDDEARLGGLLAAEAVHVPFEKRISAHIGKMEDETAFEEWVRRWEPDCVISFATANRWWLRDMEVDAGYAACFIPEFATSPVAGMVENGTQMMAGALELLDQEIRHRRRGLSENAHETVVESVFQDGPTLRDHPKE